MEEERKEEGKISSSWSVSTNWTVVHGSLRNSVSFESPISPIPEEEEEEQNASRSSDRLILDPPPPDSGPCEITVSFTQMHEVRQVYVRSTARVYEIYYAARGQSDNEYLCTVRCGVAERDGEVLHSEVFEFQDRNGKTVEPPKDISQSSISSDEDGWVEVKVPDSSPLNGTNATDRNIQGKLQDYYEATAEITDSSPCISITLRLLSLQVKGSLHIEEIYIFADPAEPIDSPKSQNSGGTGSNVLAMLVPSLLELSRSRHSRIQQKHDHDIMEGQILGYGGSTPSVSIGPEAKTVQQEIFSTVQQEVPSKAADPGVLMQQSPNTGVFECKNFGSRGQISSVENMQGSISREKNNHVERMLDHLDSRMGRIEDFCARFEENILKPLNCMATRLDQVEQKLDALLARSHPPTSVSCLRFVAPEFSVGESESNDNTRSPAYDASESVQKDISDPSHKKQFSLDDNASTLAEPAPELRPCLVVTAPEFSTDDDDADKSCDDSLEPVRKDLIDPEFPDVNDGNKKCDDTAVPVTNDCDAKKASLSIDDALASALSAFISSASTQIPKLSATLRVKAPDFANEDDDSEESPLSPITGVSSGTSEDPNISCSGSDGLESSESTACIHSSQESKICVEHDMKCPQETLMATVCSTAFSGDPTATQNQLDGRHTDCSSTEESTNGAVTVDWQKRNGTENSNTETSSDEGVIFGEKKPLECMYKGSIDTLEGKSPDQLYEERKNPGGGDSTIGFQLINGGNGDESKDGLCQTSKSALDFNIPILDVKFTKQGDGSHSLPLEKLLCNQQVREKQVTGGKDDCDDSDAISKQNHLASPEDTASEDLIEVNQSPEMEDTFKEHTAPSYEPMDITEPSVGLNEELLSSLI